MPGAEILSLILVAFGVLSDRGEWLCRCNGSGIVKTAGKK
jgi:hypothetical protein